MVRIKLFSFKDFNNYQLNMKNLQLLILAGFAIFLFSCEKLEDTEKYARPDWLAGKLYDQILDQESLSIFAEALELTGYDTIINVSGSYTVFAPTDEAFQLFFNENPQYNGELSNVPVGEVEKIVKFHIIQNPWNRTQLQTLNPSGWITDDDHPIDSKPWSYKRQTLLSDPNEKYYYVSDRGVYTIVDSLKSDQYRIVYSGKRKYAPIYFDEYFELNSLSHEDYSFYYNRPYNAGNLYYCGAEIGIEVFAENGFIYPIDRVVEPSKNGKQLLEQGLEGKSYSSFLDLIYQFPEFNFNREATFSQTEALAGQEFDSLFNLNYPDLLFRIHDEEYQGSFSRSTQRHYGLLAPDDDAFQKFLDEVVTAKSGYPHWAELEIIPDEIKKLIVNAHMSDFPVYKTNIDEGFYNGLDDKVFIAESDISEKYYGSNCTFLGLSEAVIPRAFSSVTAPVYLRPGYSTFMRCMEYSRVLPALKRPGTDFAFYVLSDERLALDSSAIVNWIDQDLNRYNIRAFHRGEEQMMNMSRTELGKRILNQVAVSRPAGVGRKEFLENLAGNYITVDNENNLVYGSKPNSFGYLGDSLLTPDSPPVRLAEPTDNGETYDVLSWFSFNKTTLFALVQSYSKFYELLIKAGMVDAKNYVFTFINEGDFYTVFAPTNSALLTAQADTLQKADLQKLLRYHFVPDHLIFTDGKKPSGEYLTSRPDDSSGGGSGQFATINLETGVDYINILNDQGELYYRIDEASNITNRMGISYTGELDSYWEFITTAVVHQVDTVLIK
jgi:uncharacterized surface protein with fasciclin (FAS1) repeats